MDRKILLDVIKNGYFFSITFLKRTTGEIRRLNGRYGVVKGIKGTGQPYNPADYNLITVWDAQAKGYRNIPAEGILEIRCRGQIWDMTNA